MPVWKPVSRRDLIRALKDAGFEGPFSGGKHEYLERGAFKLWIPNPHDHVPTSGDIGVGFLKRILVQAGISRDDWEKL
jgi:predicted RNA binding protein YcfA (HicA-like mRNA interferase family)